MVNRGGVTVSGDSAGISCLCNEIYRNTYVCGAKGPDYFDCSGFTHMYIEINLE